MKYFLLIAAALSMSACDKPAETTPEVPETAAQTAKEPNAPEAPAESAESADKHQAMEEKAQLADDIKPGETKLFGAPFTIIEPPVTLAAAIEKSAENPNSVKIEAKVERACKAKGCWFTLTGDGVETPVRVKMKDYGFFVPRNADGSRAIVEGTLVSREMPVEEAKHYAQDEGKLGDEITAPQKTYEITATSVEIYAPAS